MRAMTKALLVGGLLLGLGACVTALPPEKTAALGGPFNEEVKQGYLRLAESRRAATDPADWYHFRSKAYEVLDGDVVWPDKVASRKIPAAYQTEAVELRERLVSDLESGIRERTPVDAAAAQVAFDCWLEELESVKDPSRFSDCKETFLEALARAEAAMVEQPYLVLFDSGSDRLDPDAMNVVTRAARAAQVARPARIDVIGYADPSGRAADNQALSQRRAEAVADALSRAGVPSNTIRASARGAIEGAAARRVEITFSG